MHHHGGGREIFGIRVDKHLWGFTVAEAMGIYFLRLRSPPMEGVEDVARLGESTHSA
jgi:hypothetical protein